jgi:hypothetical protein
MAPVSAKVGGNWPRMGVGRSTEVDPKLSNSMGKRYVACAPLTCSAGIPAIFLVALGLIVAGGLVLRHS